MGVRLRGLFLGAVGGVASLLSLAVRVGTSPWERGTGKKGKGQWLREGEGDRIW